MTGALEWVVVGGIVAFAAWRAFRTLAPRSWRRRDAATGSACDACGGCASGKKRGRA